MSITIAFRGDSQVNRDLQQLVQRGENPRPALTSIGRALLTRVQMGFRSARDPYGEAWRPLNTTLTRSGQPLSKSRLLRESFVYQVTDNAVEIGSNRTVSWRGNTYSLAAIHQFGAIVRARWAPSLAWRGAHGQLVKAKKTRIPARPMLPDEQRGLPEAWERDAEQAVADHMRGGSRA